MSEVVDHPAHYQHPSGIECIDIVENMSFNMGNAVKYIWRREQKGDVLTNLRKSRWYIQRERKRRAGSMHPEDATVRSMLLRVGEHETPLVRDIYRSIGDVIYGDALIYLDQEIARLESTP